MQNVYVKYVALKGKGLFAIDVILENSIIFPFEGIVLPLNEASKLSLQINKYEALESLATIDDFLNHSCEPNARVIISEKQAFLWSIRRIEKDEEITFNYNSTEYDLIEQKCDFECQCGSSNCLKTITGFKYLNNSDRFKIRNLLIPYLIDC